ncbi:MAG: hypothetical protein BYD32DRAFT_406351 [Podila humilis]|nr:MAG: hypothetical protein BYD32DRAFT_406351 [Podila humilis]
MAIVREINKIFFLLDFNFFLILYLLPRYLFYYSLPSSIVCSSSSIISISISTMIINTENVQTMDIPPPCFETSSRPRKTAVLLIGNSGTGKSTLLSQLSSKGFVSGASLRTGVTKDVREEEILIHGQRLVLIDVPGLYEPDDDETQRNANELTKALSKKGYDYKLYFVMKADNRGPLNSDLVMMSKVNQCIKKVDGSRVSFRIIVNQITDQEVYDLYEQRLANDNFATLFKSLKIPGYSFDIKIDKVLLLRFSKEHVRRRGFKDVIAADVFDHSQTAINVEELKVSNEDLSLFEAAVMTSWLGVPVAVAGRVAMIAMGGGVAAGAAVNGGLAVSAIGGLVWMLYKGGKWAYRTVQKARAKEEKVF